MVSFTPIIWGALIVAGLFGAGYFMQSLVNPQVYETVNNIIMVAMLMMMMQMMMPMITMMSETD